MERKNKNKYFEKEKGPMNLSIIILLSLIFIVFAIVIMNSASAQIAPPDVTKDATPTDINVKGTGFDEITTITIEVTGSGNTTTTTVPMEIVFAIDSSGSMQTSDSGNLRISACQNFVDMMDNTIDLGGVVSWDHGIDFTYGLSSNFVTLKNQIGNVDAWGGTNLDVGLNAAVNMLNPPNPAKVEVIIFLTDGFGGYTYFPGGPVGVAASNGYVIYSIGLGTGHNPAPLIDMATATGGQYFNAPTAANLQAIFNAIYTQIVISTIPHYVDVIEVTQSCIVDEGVFNIAPNSVSTVGGITTIVWNNIGLLSGDGDPDLSDDETVTLTFEAKSDCCQQNLPVDVYGTARVEYDDNNGVYAGTVLIPQEYINVDCDTTPPTTVKTHGPCVSYDPSSGIWYMQPCNPIYLYARDLVPLATGVRFLYYEVWWDVDCDGIYDVIKFSNIVFDNNPDDLNPTFGEIDVEIHIDQECCHKLVWYAVDNFGNQENPHVQFYRMDGTPPTIKKTHPDPCYFPISPTEGLIKIGADIVLNAIDGGTPPCISGVSAIYWGFELDGIWHPIDITDTYYGNNVGYYKDGKWWYYYSQPIEFHEECKHVLEYWAIDLVCNIGQTYSQTYWVNKCQNTVYIDDNFGFFTPGWWHTHFRNKQMALDWLGPYGTAYVYDGVYQGDISIDNVPCCDNIGITQMGEYGCFPILESAVIKGSETIKVPYVKIKYLEYTPNTNGAIIVEPNIYGTYLRCNKFRKDCVANAIGVNAKGGSTVNARLNWWGAPDGPSGGIMDDGKTADGLGVKIFGDVFVEPWIGIHAEISIPTSTIEVEVGTPVNFDATGSWAYTYGECCQEPKELPIQYLWDFDDGKQSANKITQHLFEQTGTYQVSLMVDAPGIPGLYPNFMYDWAYITVHVVTEQTPLTCYADGGNLEGYQTIVNEPLQLYGDAYGGNGDYTWYWNFGDQTMDSTEQNPVHTYTEPGTYTATLTVISDGETAIDNAEVIVYDIDELFVTINNVNTIVGTETMFAASINGGTPPYSIIWDFGDGSTLEETNPTHVYSSPGEYTVTVTVTDDRQKTATDTAVMTVEEETNIEITEIKDIKGGLGIKAIIAAGDNNCHWEISVEGTVILGGENSGIINANTQETVRLGFSLAIGNVDILVKAAGIEKHYTAFALGPLYLNLQET